jgi:hypothetical protein
VSTKKKNNTTQSKQSKQSKQWLLFTLKKQSYSCMMGKQITSDDMMMISDRFVVMVSMWVRIRTIRQVWRYQRGNQKLTITVVFDAASSLQHMALRSKSKDCWLVLGKMCRLSGAICQSADCCFSEWGNIQIQLHVLVYHTETALPLCIVCLSLSYVFWLPLCIVCLWATSSDYPFVLSNQKM